MKSEKQEKTLCLVTVAAKQHQSQDALRKQSFAGETPEFCHGSWGAFVVKLGETS